MRRTKMYRQGAQEEAITVAARLTGPRIECGCKVVHGQLMCNIPTRANLHTGYSSCWVPGDIISYPFYDM